jgi:hypothetical protein
LDPDAHRSRARAFVRKSLYWPAKHAGKDPGLDGALGQHGRRFVRKSGVGIHSATPAAG